MSHDRQEPDVSAFRDQSTTELQEARAFLATVRRRLKHDRAYAARFLGFYGDDVVNVRYCDRRILMIDRILLERGWYLEAR